ncbi:peptidoglycan editing factor PgeF [Halobacillus sp. BBL2006]|uniref:peptidoglycan editing factor PgeF n=1 Tax=Halobacillus sp. BBL2006 TaxID=1543706 RepID=UPI000542A916|nr:peptidoglycan editing factor PgeF [Halobacillus sp. BBL2006]KHE73034.1 hypothetical protein LD39_01405 [Halobacillus sp. BBL2006]
MVEPFKHETLRQLTCFREHKNLIAGITTRQGGYSQKPFDSLNMGLHVPDREEIVLENRKELADEIGIPLERWVMGEQVHDKKVNVVTEEDLGKGVFSHTSALAGVDGLITNQPDILLAAFYADCVPLFFCDPLEGWIGVAHAGWKGTVKGMAAAMINELIGQGCSVENIEMIIGPCIGSTHYEVDERVKDGIPQSHHSETIKELGNGKYLLDLKRLNERVALEAGVHSSHIFTSGYCTYEEEALFYSHRRDQGKTGRMLGYIGWKS